MFLANQLICLHCQITNQNMQKTMENEDEITFHLSRMYRPSHRAFAVEKNSSHRKQVWQVVFRFSLEIFTYSGSRYNFLKFCCPFSKYCRQMKISSALVDAICQVSSD